MKEAGLMAATRLVYERPDGKWAWRLTGEDNQIIASGGPHGYESEVDARTVADKVITGHFSDAEKRRRPKPVAHE
jgi:uncharacterized protein YegP (UPF0339 family)